MKICTTAVLTALLSCITLVSSAVGQKPDAQIVDAQPQDARESARVLVLGTYHFANPGLDVVQTEVADILGPERQREVLEVASMLARFRPTRIAVEVRPERAASLDSAYAAYRAGSLELGRNEVQQLGFRLAKEFGHDRLFAIDHAGEFPFNEVMAYAQEHDERFVIRVQQILGQIADEHNRMQRENTLAEILRHHNDPAEIRRGRSFYLETGTVGAGDSYVGAELLSKWYDRNIRIFANVLSVAEPGERVLVIIGSGHAAILRELLGGDRRVILVEANSYLNTGTDPDGP